MAGGDHGCFGSGSVGPTVQGPRRESDQSPVHVQSRQYRGETRSQKRQHFPDLIDLPKIRRRVEPPG